MQRLLVFFIMFAIFTAPARAQQPVSNPAAYLPASTAIYAELRSDEAGMTAFNQLTSLGLRAADAPAAMQGDVIDLVLTPALTSWFPGIDVRADILPWLGDRVGAGILSESSAQNDIGGRDTIFVLPVRDAAAANAFVSKFMGSAETQSVGGVPIYQTATVGLAVGSGVIWLSSPAGIDLLLATPMLERLSDNPHFQKVWGALPADAALTAYLSAEYLLRLVANFESILPEGQPTYGMMAEAALRLHPAQSAAEEALLAAKGLDGFGVALQVADDRIDVTAALSVAAQYAAPALPTATAGTALLTLIPNDSFVVFDSYDVSVTAVPIVGLALLGPVIGSVFDSIVAGLGPVDATPTPTPTPTPAPPMTVDALMAQVQPGIRQIESLMGMSLAQLNDLINGEYAVAVFPGPGPTLGAALYLQSSDPQHLIDTIDRVSKLFLTDPATGAQVVTVQHQTISGVDVALLGEAGVSDRPALGIVNENVLFITLESSAAKVIDAAQAAVSAPPALIWASAFGEAQEALLYLDPRTLDLYTLRQQRNPPLPLTALAGSFDLRDNGLFVLRLALLTSSS